MTPSLALADVPHGSLGDAVSLREYTGGFAASEDGSGVGIGHLGSPVALSVEDVVVEPASLHAVPDVLASSDPLKVLNPVVGTIRVPMVYLLAFGGLAQECTRYQPMNVVPLAGEADSVAQEHGSVPVLMGSLLVEELPDARPLGSRIPSDEPIGRYGVEPLESRYVSPCACQHG